MCPAREKQLSPKGNQASSSQRYLECGFRYGPHPQYTRPVFLKLIINETEL